MRFYVFKVVIFQTFHFRQLYHHFQAQKNMFFFNFVIERCSQNIFRSPQTESKAGYYQNLFITLALIHERHPKFARLHSDLTRKIMLNNPLSKSHSYYVSAIV